ncbi:hypothetical protein [Brucella intermedia]|uniref:hypothetical protein n=1 Tax=Brucella intermedia TaxID=94625 RepID=UPI00224B5A89|nr:hypothetical protein [Brucella intermedia]
MYIDLPEASRSYLFARSFGLDQSNTSNKKSPVRKDRDQVKEDFNGNFLSEAG